ncbi:tRNA1(Val) (adenine(37)-N6)-methyltransferase [Coprobacter tertius]|uniref:tRNA1(Val) (adenine(37)-N6)-methyltransferase n=1 Tax=Coprobacter tertius TaxID=2944915 RepID=A0ABT1MHN6_9BACT|nr:methyltransferase [Coprobacter tertius]MCP9612150.1 methyltransferase [Coprobacter tertius]
MGNPFFKFKRFTINQDRCAMKVSTDSALLGAWCHFPKTGEILDIGCGCGILSLMAAQRSEACITGIEIDREAALQAAENVYMSEWKERIKIICEDFCVFTSYTESKYDCVISNPPYFVNSLLPPTLARKYARHTTTLNYYSLFKGISAILHENGSIFLIFPADILEHVIEIAAGFDYFPLKITSVRGRSDLPVKRMLTEWKRGIGVCHYDEIIIESDPGIYTSEFITLLRDFYLKF